MKIKKVLEMVKNEEAIVLMDDTNSGARIEKTIGIERVPQFAPYIYGENNEIKWGEKAIDFGRDLIDESEIEYD